jgi:hypothetical protein
MPLLLITLLAALLTPSPPGALHPEAELARGDLVVIWIPPPDQFMACVFARTPDRLLGCVTAPEQASFILPAASRDVRLQVRQGETVEVRVYALSGAVAGRGTAGVRGRAAWLPVVVR